MQINYSFFRGIHLTHFRYIKKGPNQCILDCSAPSNFKYFKLSFLLYFQFPNVLNKAFFGVAVLSKIIRINFSGCQAVAPLN